MSGCTMWSIWLISVIHSARYDCNIWWQEKHKTLYMITLQTALYSIYFFKKSGCALSFLFLEMSTIGPIRARQSHLPSIRSQSLFFSPQLRTEKWKADRKDLFWSRIPAPAPHPRDHCLSSPFENKCGGNFHGNGSGTKYCNFSFIETHSAPWTQRLIRFEGSDE